MALESITTANLGPGGAGLSDGKLRRAIKELQQLTTAVVAGAGATTNIAVTGIATTDTLQSVIMFTAGVPSNVTSTASITSAGNIQLTGSSAGNTLIVTYWKKAT